MNYIYENHHDSYICRALKPILISKKKMDHRHLKLVSLTKLPEVDFRDAEEFSEKMLTQAIVQIKAEVKKTRPDLATSMESLTDRLEMTLRGLAPVTWEVNSFCEITVMAFEEEDRGAFHVTRYMLMGEQWQFSYETQDACIHEAYSKYVESILA
ncbi:hypothetical protein [Vibrio crassostreae]|uniref:hypothetical protein n=1 Tax=Vibrio crassostreae TaxID=246167 RepID=UPI001B30EC87|nr:hypothetical protein [Vibrio crassostreae]